MQKKLTKNGPVIHGIHERRVILVVFGLLFCLPWFVNAAEPTDVRLLIDVSGSMKQNDPQNLRAPAQKLLVDLLPEGNRAGVWTFGRYVNMEVKWDKVSQDWKDKARAAAERIHSRGLYTNIEGALERSTRDWTKPDPNRRRHLILLTDGHVDISKDPAVNAESRRRSLQEILPRLEDAGVTVHTIALSSNVDFELLYALSGATDGLYEEVKDASQLQKVFLRIFDQAVVPDAVPLKDNRFSVDDSISDVTVLVFRNEGASATQLINPAGEVMTQAKHPPSVNWLHEQNYDLMTIKQPQTGEWNIKAEIDPDNRVLIVTNLSLAVDKLPTNLMLGDRFDVKARLQEKGKTLSRDDLLKLLSFEAELSSAGTEVEKLVLADNGTAPDVLARDGVYSAAFQPMILSGRYELKVRAAGGALQREFRHNITVYDTAASIEVKESVVGFDFVISPHAGLLRANTVSMQIQLPDGNTITLQQQNETSWAASIPKEYAGKVCQIVLTGTRYNGANLTQRFDQEIAATVGMQPLKIAVNKLIPPKKTPEEHPPAEQTPVKSTEPSDGDKVQEPDASEHAEEGFDWTMVIIIIVAINAFLLVGGVVGYLVWKKRRIKQLAQQDEDMAL